MVDRGRTGIVVALLASTVSACERSPVESRREGSVPTELSAAPLAAPLIDLSAYCDGADDLDDTACIREWIEAGRASPNVTLYASGGTYLYSEAMPLYRRLRLECQGPTLTTFRRNGGSGLFLTAAAPVDSVRIAKCGFDVRGSHENFLAVIAIPYMPAPSTDIEVRNNRFSDSEIPGQISAEQRQYILLLNCNDCRVERNHLSEGGRIKVGQPGRHILIRQNIVEQANDNAITVVDIGSGVSEDITVVENRVLQPKAIGIFFGADGQAQTSPTLATRRVRIARNYIEGDWQLACIFGELPAIADEIQVIGNTCVKTDSTVDYAAGIAIIRTDNAQLRATNIVVDRDTVLSLLSPESGTALDYGGIFFNGRYAGVRVTRNVIRNVGPRAMLFYSAADIIDARITGNILVGGALVIEGSVQGVVQK